MGLSVAAVVLGAGSGRRLSGTNKALLTLAGEPMIAHSLRALRGVSSIAQIIVVMNPHDQERLLAEWRVSPQDLGADVVIPGGCERWLSSQAGCQASTPPPQVADADSLLLVHDAARPMVQPSDIQAVVHAAQENGAALLAEPVADTLKSSGQDSHVLDTVSRDCLWRAQTPQVARRDWLLEAFAHWANHRKDNPTDESMLLEFCGHSPRLVASSAPNFKVTTQRDLQLAEALLRTTLAAKSPSS